MPDTQLYTREGASAKATVTKTTLALSKLRFFKSTLVVSQFTTKDQLEAAECDFDGYTAGGYTLTAWTGPAWFAGGGAVITSPLTVVAYGPAGDPPVGNAVGGWWIETAAGAVWTVGQYDPPRLLQVVGDAIQFIDQLVEARNPLVEG